MPEHIFFIREEELTGIIDKLVADKVDGIFCFNDIIAFVVMEALEARGLIAGEDYGIVGYDNIQQMMRMPRIITTIDMGSYDLAQAGADAMLALLSGSKEDKPAFINTHRSRLVRGRSTRM